MDRDLHMCLMFYVLIRRYSRDHSQKTARRMAYAAVCLRFNITEVRARHIICGNARNDCGRSVSSMLLENAELVDALVAANVEYAARKVAYDAASAINPTDGRILDISSGLSGIYAMMIEENEKLIGILRDTGAEYERR